METASILLEQNRIQAKTYKPRIIKLNSAPVSYRVPATFYTTHLKRFLDVVAALGVIVFLLSWMLPILIILIKSTSKGSIFFVQERIGLNGRIFRCFKFRTMEVNTECDKVQANCSDKRVTRIGHALRKTHIDELPQVFNVLINDMSLIGPRPHMLYHDELFSEAIPDYHYRHGVKPGITGMAQSLGYHGATPDFFSIYSRTRLDLFYVTKISLLLDIRILLHTLSLKPSKTALEKPCNN